MDIITRQDKKRKFEKLKNTTSIVCIFLSVEQWGSNELRVWTRYTSLRYLSLFSTDVKDSGSCVSDTRYWYMTRKFICPLDSFAWFFKERVRQDELGWARISESECKLTQMHTASSVICVIYGFYFLQCRDGCSWWVIDDVKQNCWFDLNLKCLKSML